MLTGYTTALPPSAALPPVGVPALIVDAHLLGIALVAGLAITAMLIVVHGGAGKLVRRPVLRIRAARAATSDRAA